MNSYLMPNLDFQRSRSTRPEQKITLSFSSLVGEERQRIRTAVCVIIEILDFSPNDDLTVTKEQFERVKTKMPLRFPDIEFVETEGCKIEIRIKKMQDDTAGQAMAAVDGIFTPSDTVTGEYHEHWVRGEWQQIGEDIRTCIGFAMELNTPKSKARRVKWRIWFNKDTHYFEYRGEKLSWRDENFKLVTLKRLKDWRSEVNRRKQLN